MRLAVLLIVTGALGLADLTGVFAGALDHPAIEYQKRPVHDAVAELNRKLDGGKRLYMNRGMGICGGCSMRSSAA